MFPCNITSTNKLLIWALYCELVTQSGRVCSPELCDSQMSGKSSVTAPTDIRHQRSHLVGLPGQVGVPSDGDNLDDGQPTAEGPRKQSHQEQSASLSTALASNAAAAAAPSRQTHR